MNKIIDKLANENADLKTRNAVLEGTIKADEEEISRLQNILNVHDPSEAWKRRDRARSGIQKDTRTEAQKRKDDYEEVARDAEKTAEMEEDDARSTFLAPLEELDEKTRQKKEEEFNQILKDADAEEYIKEEGEEEIKDNFNDGNPFKIKITPKNRKILKVQAMAKKEIRSRKAQELHDRNPK